MTKPANGSDRDFVVNLPDTKSLAYDMMHSPELRIAEFHYTLPSKVSLSFYSHPNELSLTTISVFHDNGGRYSIGLKTHINTEVDIIPQVRNKKTSTIEDDWLIPDQEDITELKLAIEDVALKSDPRTADKLRKVASNIGFERKELPIISPERNSALSIVRQFIPRL